MPRKARRLPPSRVPGALAPRTLQRLLAFIETNVGQAITVAELATITGFSIAHFSRRFARSVGTAPARYVHLRRIDRGKQLLTHSVFSLAEIALACGFADQAHFTRSFHIAVGMTPRAYRCRSQLPPSASKISALENNRLSD
jgi:AraC family transcriptional regulator